MGTVSLIRRFAPRERVVLSGKPPRLLEGALVGPGVGKIQADALFLVEVLGGDSVFVSSQSLAWW